MLSDLDAEAQAWIGVTVDDEKADWFTSGEDDGLIVWPDQLPDPWQSGESAIGLTHHPKPVPSHQPTRSAGGESVRACRSPRNDGGKEEG